MVMEHVCPHCGRPLLEGASFCPGCTKSINRRERPSPPRPISRRERPSPPRPISRRVLYAVDALLILLAVCFGIWLTGCPQELEGMGGEMCIRDSPFVCGIVDLESGAPLFLGTVETLN